MNQMDKVVKDINFRVNNTGKKYYKSNDLTPKQANLLSLYISGMDRTEALIKAGYHRTNCSVWNKLKPYIDILQKEKMEEIKKSVVSKDEIICTLKNIMENDDDNRTKILAIDKLIKVYGFEAPNKTENVNENHTIIKMELDE